VVDDAAALDRAGHHGLVGHAALHEGGPLGDVLGAAGRQVVQHDHLVATRQQRVHEVRSDEPGSTGDEGTHGPDYTEGL
jgi:hypothetical protein